MSRNQSSDKISTATLMSVEEMISTAFGNENSNVINFKILQTILIVLANQLRLLERQVAVEIDPSVIVSSNNLSVTEFKIVSTTQKKKQIHDTKAKHKHRQTPDQTTKTRSHDDKKFHKHRHDRRKGELNEDKPSDKSAKTKIQQPVIYSLLFGNGSQQTHDTGRNKDKMSDDLSAVDSSLPSSLKESSDISKDTIKHDETQEILTSDTGHDKTGTTLRKIPPVNSETMSQVKYTDLLEKIEEQRERILRIIHQRKNSLEESVSSPTPMTSIRSSEIKMEKLLVVEKLSGEAIDNRDRNRPLSIVTQDEFNRLVEIVVELQKRFIRNDDDASGETSLLEEIRKGSASLSEAVGALQLSTRLEQVEGNIDKLINQITQLAANPPTMHLTQLADNKSRFEVLESTTTYHQVAEKKSKKLKKYDDWSEIISVLQLPASMTSFTSESSSDEEVSPRSQMKTTSDDELPYVKKKELKSALKIEQTDILKLMFKRIKHIKDLATEALRNSRLVDSKLTLAMNVSQQYQEVERMVSSYAEQVSKIDAMLIAQSGNFQDQIAQLQFDLETGLENFAEAIARLGADPELVLDLNTKMANLHDDIETSNALFKETRQIQNTFALDINALKKEIELLRDIKADRDEVWDALRDKAGIKDINNLVAIDQFMATITDFEKKITKSYDTYNIHEMKWQNAIDELYEKFHCKADFAFIKGLRDDITRHLNRFKNELEAIQKVVGEPFASGTTKRIYHDAACISCSNPAHPAPAEAIVPRLPSMRPRPIGSEISKSKGHGDRSVCIPGLPIPHARDSTTEMCFRYCGGSQLQQSISPRNIHGADTAEPNEKVCKHKRHQAYKTPCLPCNHEPREGSTAISNSGINVGTAKICRYDDKDQECPCSVDQDIQPSGSMTSVATGVLLSLSDF